MPKFNYISDDNKSKTTVLIEDQYVTISYSIRVPTRYGKTRWKFDADLMIDRSAWEAITARAGKTRPLVG